TMARRGRRGAQSRRYEQNRRLKNFVKGLKPSVRVRLLELDSRTLGELLGVTTQQEKGAGSLPEGEATPKENMIKPFQKQDKKKEKPLESQESTVASSIEKPECTQCGKRHDEVHSARRFTDRDIGGRVTDDDLGDVTTGMNDIDCLVHINLLTSVGYMSHCDDALFIDGDWYNRTGMKRVVTLVKVATGSDQNVTRGCEERNKAVKTGREIATGHSLHSECDGFSIMTRPQNAAYRAIAFTGGRFVQVAADEKGKKNGLVWTISCSPATKNSSTRPQQDAPHISPRHDTTNTSTPIDLSQLVDILQSLQASQLQKVQAVLKGKSIPDPIQALHPNVGVHTEPARDPTGRASPAPSPANSIIHSCPHTLVGRPSHVWPSLDVARPTYPPQALAHIPHAC
ncbi:hypothetical protein Taro_041196, partial [Colocasia esculenta]|nr:hypothetical protein [Colocasia esculenta]